MLYKQEKADQADHRIITVYTSLRIPVSYTRHYENRIPISPIDFISHRHILVMESAQHRECGEVYEPGSNCFPVIERSAFARTSHSSPVRFQSREQAIVQV
jgi:hypothetical protein